MDPFLDKNSPAAKPEKEWEGIQTNGFTCPLAFWTQKQNVRMCQFTWVFCFNNTYSNWGVVFIGLLWFYFVSFSYNGVYFLWFDMSSGLDIERAYATFLISGNEKNLLFVLCSFLNWLTGLEDRIKMYFCPKMYLCSKRVSKIIVPPK